MNTSARGRRIVLLVFLGSLGLSGVATFQWVGRKLPPLAVMPSGEIASVHFPVPVELSVNGKPFPVSRFVLNLDRRMLRLERDELSFNDYGDATRTGGEPPLELPVSLEREWPSNRFAVVPPCRFDQNLRLVVFPGNPNNFRLIVVSGNNLRIIDLRPPQTIPDEFGDWPQGDTFKFKSMSYGLERHGYNGLDVDGSLPTGGRVGYDPNGYMFTPEGDVTGSTLLGWSPTRVTFRPLGADPAALGRRAFELLPKLRNVDDTEWPRAQNLKDQHILVLGPTELSEHRLVVLNDGRVVQIMRLSNRERDHFRDSLRNRLRDLTDRDRLLFQELGKHRCFGVCFESGTRDDPKNGHITSLSWLNGDLAKVDATLAQLPHLVSINFRDATLPPEGMPSLQRLTKLWSVSFIDCTITDETLRSVGQATGLKEVYLSNVKGFGSAGVAHLGALRDLQSLNIYRHEDVSEAPLIDDGLKGFVGMKSLTTLILNGQNVSDAGLEHIGKIHSLTRLEVSGASITDAGLKHLEQLPNLPTLHLSNAPGVTPKGWASFHATRPKRNGP